MFFMQSFKVIGLHNIHDVSIYREENYSTARGEATM